MRNISFSRTYPSYHPKKGQPTFFVEKILNELDLYPEERSIGIINNDAHHGKKSTTIRAGHRWKAGDWFQPVYWGDDINRSSGRSGPYHSKMVKFCPPIQIKKVWDFEIKNTSIWVNDNMYVELNGAVDKTLLEVAKNDGLSLDDLLSWFKHPNDFDGQIICWNENILM